MCWNSALPKQWNNFENRLIFDEVKAYKKLCNFLGHPVYVHGGHLGFWKSHTGGERPPGINFIETLRTIEKSKETIVKRPNKVMGPATRLLVVSRYTEIPNRYLIFSNTDTDTDFGILNTENTENSVRYSPPVAVSCVTFETGQLNQSYWFLVMACSPPELRVCICWWF